MKLQNGTVLKCHVDYIKGRQASTNDIVKSEDDFYSVGTYPEGTSVPVDEQCIVEPRRSNCQRRPPQRYSDENPTKMGEDVVTLTKHSLEFLVVCMRVILYNTFL